MEPTGGVIIGASGIDLFSEVAEVVGFVVAGYLGGPFFVSFVHFDAFSWLSSLKRKDSFLTSPTLTTSAT